MNLVTELFNIIARRHNDAFATHAAALDELFQARDESKSPADELARRRLAHPRLKTSYPDRELRTLKHKIAEDRIAVLKPAQLVIEKLIEIEHNEAIVASLDEAWDRTIAEHRDRAETGLHVGAKRVVDRLRRQGINRAHWAALGVDEIDQIGAFIMRCSKARRGEIPPP